MQPLLRNHSTLERQDFYKKSASPSSLGIGLFLVVAVVWSALLVVMGVGRLVRPLKGQLVDFSSSRPYRFTQVKTVPAGIFGYGGSTAWSPIRLLVDSSIQSERLEFQLRYVEPRDSPSSSSEGIRMLLSGQLSFAQSARPLLEWEYEAATRQGFRLKQIPIAIDGIALAVDPQLNLSGLTLNQLQLIYGGQIRNWKQLGGPDLEIATYWRFNSAISSMTFPVGGLSRRPMQRANLEFVPTTTQALRRLAEFPGGLYYASASQLVPQCSAKLLPLGRQPGKFVAPSKDLELSTDSSCSNQRRQVNLRAFQTGQYPITRYLYVIVKEDGSVDQRAGEAYAKLLLTSQGQALLSQAGFAPLR